MNCWKELNLSADRSLRDDVLKDLVEKLRGQKSKHGCPSTKCPHVKTELILAAANCAANTVVALRSIFEEHGIDADHKLREEILVIITDAFIKLSMESAITTIDLCQACVASTMLEKHEVQ